MKKAQPATKYEILGYFLGQLGESKITREQFLKEIEARGWGQGDIDKWTDEFYVIEAKKDEDNARREREKEQSRAARGATAGYARGQDGGQRKDHQEEHPGDEQSVQRQRPAAPNQDARQEGYQGDEAQRSRAVGRKFITLKAEHIEFADKIAARRRERGLLRGARNGHNIERPEFSFEVLGSRCEAAGKLFLNPVKWHAYSETVGGLPDLDDFIDVKGAPKSHHRMPVQQGQPDNWAYLLILGHNHPVYELVGWAWGFECKAGRELQDPVGGMPAYWIDQSDPIMKPPQELFDELRRRQEWGR